MPGLQRMKRHKGKTMNSRRPRGRWNIHMITQLARRFWPLLPLGLLLGGCITSKEISIYAVDIESETAVAQPPIYVTENPEAGRVEGSASI